MKLENERRSGARNAQVGFTLMELMIVVAIVGILAMIALPSYDRYITRSNRAIAKNFLLAIASKQEQYLLDARKYASAVSALGLTTPPEATNKYTFSIACSSADCTGYTATATAVGAQLADGNLTIDNLGNKLPADKWTN